MSDLIVTPTPELVASMHAAHAGTPGQRGKVAKDSEALVDAAVAAWAAKALGAAATAFAAGATEAQDATGAAVMSGTGAFLSGLATLVKAGARPRDVLAAGGGLAVPEYDATSAREGLLNARGQLALKAEGGGNPSTQAAAKASIPLLGGMLELALTNARVRHAYVLLEFTRADGTVPQADFVIPSGTGLTGASGIPFSTTAVATHKRGTRTVSISADCGAAGSQANVPAGDLSGLILVGGIAYSVRNPKAAAGGKDALAWGVGVSLPFASGVALRGAMSGNSVAVRKAQLAYGWAARTRAS